ncbi:MAG TPA: hypothetical protein DCP60_01585 [Psychrobacter sp.]|nr:hypothetical protein [Psychrobacter sp.]|tara:strand:- start:1780 stop:1974 length:195 start_codon:yes stop_codon:yes gene_type:complete
MSKDNKISLKADHSQHSDNQHPKRKRSIIGYISIIACLLMLLLATSCQPKHPQIFTQLEAISHD